MSKQHEISTKKKRVRFFMNPYDEETIPKCPHCGSWTENKTYTFICKAPTGKLNVLDLDCKYCSACNLIIGMEKIFLAFQMAAQGGRRTTLGEEYFPIGTICRNDYYAFLAKEISKKEILKRASIFEEILDFELVESRVDESEGDLDKKHGTGPDTEKSGTKIYTIQVECLYLEEACIRFIEIPENYSLYHLHDSIQEALDFDKDHLFEFYAGRNERNRKVVFSEAYEWEDRHEDYLNIRLSEIWPLKGLNLYYLFDFGDNWLFRIRKGRKVKEPEKDVEYPRVVEIIGENPEQYPM